jgi:hypothetical protein
MDEIKKEEKKDLTEKNNDQKLTDKECALDGKKLHDLYRHTTKLIE